MKIAKKLKKIAAIVLSIAVVLTSVSMLSVLADDSADFDENNVVLRMGVMSDLHLAYANYNVEQIKKMVSNYANSVATLNSMSGNKLDAILLCGDYTSGGNAVQSETFASASKAILDAINKDKADADKTKFFMTYGNHDTEWSGHLSYEEWETLLGDYGLLDDVQYGPANSGSYSGTITKNGKTYYVFSVETATYNNPSNTFRTDVLQWLDEGLAAATAANPDSYVYVVSHAPIKESGVYGADMQFDKNSDWATAEAGYTSTTIDNGETYDTSSDIDGVLSKYPQVMYFSGHTHRANYLESTIMSDDYTAVTVSSVNSGDLISSVSDYLDGGNGDVNPKPGYALYLEVDANGNQRIERVVEPYGDATTTITYGEELSQENPAYNESGTVYGVVVDSVTIDSASADITKMTPWVMSAPTADKAHLVKYSAAARRRTPAFADDAQVTLTNMYSSDTDFVADVAFDAAICETNIIRYEISVVDAEGKVCGTRWALGNWTGHTYGVASGTNHQDATAFKYNAVKLSTGSIGSLIGYTVRVTAVDEFGGTASIESAAISTEPERLLENKHRDYYDNLFTVTPDRAVASSNQDNVTFSTDDNGNLVTVVDSTNGYRNAVFMTSESKYNEFVTDTTTNAPFNQWAFPGTNPQKLTDFDADDTFVYEADFSQSELGDGNFFFHLRTPDLKYDVDSETALAPWRSDYTGIVINNHGVFLCMCESYLNLSSAFKMDDTETHHIKVISSPKLISIYIDDITICESQPFTVEALGEAIIAGYTLKDRALSDKMIPTMALHVGEAGGKGRKLTVSNQKMYNYYVADENVKYTAPDYLVEDDMFKGITTDRAFALSQKDYVNIATDENGKLTVAVDFTTLTKDQWTNVCYITSKNNFDSYGASYFAGWALPGSAKAKDFTDLTADDTFIYEADFSTTEINGSNDLYFHVRTPDSTLGWQTDYTGIHITTGGTYVEMCQKTLASSSAFKFSDDETHHIKILSTPADVSVWIDGALIFDKVAFTKAAGVEKGLDETTFNSDKMYPTMAQFFMHGAFEISNQTLRKCTEVTPYTSTSQNLINSENGELYCSFANTKKDTYIIDGNNFYCDMRYFSDSAAGHKWTQARAYFFGDLNVKNTIDTKKSYVMSGLATATNASLKEEETGNTYPSRMTAYLGQYNNEEAFAFIQNTNWDFYIGSKHIAGVNLAAEYGYKIGDTVRITVLLNPFGFSYYFDGELLYSHTYEDSTLIDYQPLSFGVGGTFGIWRDVVFYENTANGKLYADAIGVKADKVNTVKGVYFTDADREVAATVKAATDAFAGTENTTLQQYVGTIDTIMSSAKVVNNMVREGLTAVGEDSAYYFNNSTYEHFGINIFGNKGCPITTEDKWQVDFDVKINAIGASNVRVIFTPYSAEGNINKSNGGIMIQDSGSHGVLNNGNGGISWQSLGSIGASIAKAGAEYHLTFKVIPLEDGTLNTVMTVSSLDGTTVYSEKTFAVAGITEIAPHIYYRTCDLEMNNLCVSYELTDNIAALQSILDTESGKDTNDIALVCVNNYNKAIATAQAILSNTDYYTRKEIDTAAAEITNAVNSFEKYGDINLDGKTNLVDLVRLKKITVGLEDETVPADMDADGDILATDVVLLKKYLIKK